MTSKTQTSTPVLFLVFNRLAVTQRVFAAIRQTQPLRLYIAADGPRSDRPGEAVQVQAVRDYILSQVNWPCEVHTLFREQNLGCRIAVSTALDWFFAHEPEGIILEDDCLPDTSFFAYVEDLLARYRDDERVMVISGNCFHGVQSQPMYSYTFSRYPHIWGWASWRRAWLHYDRDMRQWPNLRDTDWLLAIGDGDKDFQRYWTKVFDANYRGKVDSWAYRWMFSCWAQHGLGVLPAHNLVTNIGFGDGATHTRDAHSNLAELPRSELPFPLTHPPTMVRDYQRDRLTDLKVYYIKPAFMKRGVRKLYRFIHIMKEKLMLIRSKNHETHP